ncbi:MAG: endonuclease III [Isosphaeraceae bacterium]
MPGLRDQADELLAILREAAGGVTDPGPITLEAVLNAWLDDDGRVAGILLDEGLLDVAVLAEAAPSELEGRLSDHPRALNRSAVLVLQRLAAWLLERSGGDLPGLDGMATEELREGLRSVRGLGPTTIDRIVLRAFGRPRFPVGAGVYRVAVRHGWFDPTAEYDEAHSILSGLAPEDPVALASAARGLSKVADRYCKPGVPKCERCPLKPLLGPEGPIDPQG